MFDLINTRGTLTWVVNESQINTLCPSNALITFKVSLSKKCLRNVNFLSTLWGRSVSFFVY